MARPGNVVLLNGTSSAGKTSIARALQEVMDEPYVRLGRDDFRLPSKFDVTSDGTSPAAAEGFLLVFREGDVRKFVTAAGESGFAGAALSEVRIGPAGLRLLRGMYGAIGALARAGNHVVVDDVIFDRRVLAAAVDALYDLPVLFVGVRCPLAVAERRERERGDRGAGGARAFHHLVHAHGVYDMEVDTSTTSAAECAAQIRDRLLAGGAPDALRRLRGAPPPGTG